MSTSSDSSRYFHLPYCWCFVNIAYMKTVIFYFSRNIFFQTISWIHWCTKGDFKITEWYWWWRKCQNNLIICAVICFAYSIIKRGECTHGYDFLLFEFSLLCHMNLLAQCWLKLEKIQGFSIRIVFDILHFCYIPCKYWVINFCGNEARLYNVPLTLLKRW